MAHLLEIVSRLLRRLILKFTRQPDNLIVPVFRCKLVIYVGNHSISSIFVSSVCIPTAFRHNQLIIADTLRYCDTAKLSTFSNTSSCKVTDIRFLLDFCIFLILLHHSASLCITMLHFVKCSW